MCTIKSFHAKELYRNQSRLTANQQVIASINIFYLFSWQISTHIHSLAIVGDQLIDIGRDGAISSGDSLFEEPSNELSPENITPPRSRLAAPGSPRMVHGVIFYICGASQLWSLDKAYTLLWLHQICQKWQWFKLTSCLGPWCARFKTRSWMLFAFARARSRNSRSTWSIALAISVTSKRCFLDIFHLTSSTFRSISSQEIKIFSIFLSLLVWAPSYRLAFYRFALPWPFAISPFSLLSFWQFVSFLLRIVFDF